MKSLFKRGFFWRHNLMATAMVFGMMWLIAYVADIKFFNAFNPIEETFSDIELTDIVFSKIRKDPQPDTNIVLVNIGELNRMEIARQIEIINQHSPAVVGMDAFFFDLKTDTLADRYLASQLQQTENLVMVSRLEQDQYGEFTIHHASHPLFTAKADIGYANLNATGNFQRDYKTCRVFPVTWDTGKQEYNAFALEVMDLFDPEKTQILRERGNQYEVINYKANVIVPSGDEKYPPGFYTLDAIDVLTGQFNPSIIKDKIVLFGYLGEYLGDDSWEDRFYTPLNPKYAGKTNPDMYGVVIHANIISMMLQEDYIQNFSDSKGAGLLVAFIICFLNIALFSLVHFKRKKYYDIITKTIQMVEVLVILYISVMALNYLNFKFGLTLTITAIILSGDLLEIYYNSTGALVNWFKRNFEWFEITFGGLRKNKLLRKIGELK